ERGEGLDERVLGRVARFEERARPLRGREPLAGPAPHVPRRRARRERDEPRARVLRPARRDLLARVARLLELEALETRPRLGEGGVSEDERGARALRALERGEQAPQRI